MPQYVRKGKARRIKNMNERPIESTINTTLEKIKEMFDANTVIGTPIITPEATIIPYSSPPSLLR